jgi:predicted site-specific integrase-resolvase
MYGRGMSNVDDPESFVTPKQLSRELGVSEKVIRKWLREVEMRPAGEKGLPWRLPQADANYVRRQFAK